MDHAVDRKRQTQRAKRRRIGSFCLNYWGPSFTIVVVFLHLLRVFAMGAYKYPREMSWVVGVVLFLIVMLFGFTGYLLPWDQKAYWATVVGTHIAGTAPLVGDYLWRVLQGGEGVGVRTLGGLC